MSYRDLIEEANSASTSHDRMTELSKSSWDIVRLAVAQNPATPIDIIQRMAEFQLPWQPGRNHLVSEAVEARLASGGRKSPAKQSKPAVIAATQEDQEYVSDTTTSETESAAMDEYLKSRPIWQQQYDMDPSDFITLLRDFYESDAYVNARKREDQEYMRDTRKIAKSLGHAGGTRDKICSCGAAFESTSQLFEHQELIVDDAVEESTRRQEVPFPRTQRVPGSVTQ